MHLLVLPGWNDSDAGHWQSLWLRRRVAPWTLRKVEQSDWHRPLRGDWMARLEDVVSSLDGPVGFVAHSLGCHLAAAWAAHSRQRERLQAALLVAPPDLERDDVPAPLRSWHPPVLQPLPGRCLVVASSDDAYCDLEHASRMAHAWGADCLVAGPLGHINTDSALGAWDAGWHILEHLLHGDAVPSATLAFTQ